MKGEEEEEKVKNGGNDEGENYYEVGAPLGHLDIWL